MPHRPTAARKASRLPDSGRRAKKAKVHARREREKSVSQIPARGAEIVALGLVVLVPLLIHPSAAEPTVLKRVVIEVCARLLLLLMIIQALWKQRLEVAPSPVTPAAIGLLASGILSAALSRYKHTAWEAWLFQGQLIVVYLAATWIFRAPRQLSRLVFCMIASACLVSVYGVLQSFGIDFVRYRQPADRVFASQGNATYLAGYLVLLLPLFLNLGFGLSLRERAESSRHPLEKVLMLAASGLCIWCLYLTYTRAAVAGLILALAFNYLLLTKYERLPLQRRLVRGAGAVAVLAMVLIALWMALPAGEKWRLLNTFNARDYWAKRRISLWKAGLEIFREHPTVGTGPSTYQIYSRSLPWDVMTHEEWKQLPGTFHAHNEFIETASDQGIIGLICLFWLIASFLFSSVRSLGQVSEPAGRWLICGALSGVAAFLFQNLFGVTMRFAGASMFFWLMLALPAAARRAFAAEVLSGSPKGDRERGLTLPRMSASWRYVIGALLTIAWLASLPGTLKPLEAQVRLLRAQGFVEMKEWDAAARELEAALAAQPNSVQLHAALGEVYGSMAQLYGTLDRAQDALREFQAAARLNPDYRQVQYNLGVAYSNLGKHREAVKAYLRAARLQNAPWEYAALAKSYLALGRVDEAKWAAGKAAGLEPDNLEYARFLEAIESMTRRERQRED